MDWIEKQFNFSYDKFLNKVNENIEKSLKEYIEIKQYNNEYIKQNIERVIDIYSDIEIIYDGTNIMTRSKILTIYKCGLCWNVKENWKEDLLK